MDFVAALWRFLISTPAPDFAGGYVLFFVALGILFVPYFLKNRARHNKYLKKSVRRRLWPFYLIGGLGVMLMLLHFGLRESWLLMHLWLVLWGWIGGTFILRLGYLMVRDYRMRLRSVAQAKK